MEQGEPIASVPLPARFYLVNAEPGKEQFASSKRELLIKAFDSKYAAEIALEETFSRGTVMNVTTRRRLCGPISMTWNRIPTSIFGRARLWLTYKEAKMSSKNRDLLAPGRVGADGCRGQADNPA